MNPGAAFLFYRSANSAAGECAIEIGGLQAPTLDRVISVNRTLRARGGGRVVVTSLELWSSLIVFNVAVAGSEAGGPRGRDELKELATQHHFTSVLVDDLGNFYPLAGGGGGGGGDAVMQFLNYEVTHHGPVHRDASALIFRPPETAQPQELRIPLTG